MIWIPSNFSRLPADHTQLKRTIQSVYTTMLKEKDTHWASLVCLPPVLHQTVWLLLSLVGYLEKESLWLDYIVSLDWQRLSRNARRSNAMSINVMNPYSFCFFFSTWLACWLQCELGAITHSLNICFSKYHLVTRQTAQLIVSPKP